MEETNVQGSTQQSDVSDSTETNQQTRHDPQDDYRKDMFKWKNKAKELEEKIAEFELSEQQKKGNLEQVIADLKDRYKQEKLEKEQMRVNFASSKLDEAIKTEALSRGVKGQQLDVFMKLVDENAKNTVEFDDRFNIKHDDVKHVVDDHLKRYDAVFKKSVTVADASPNRNPVNRPEVKLDVNKMTAKEYKEYILKNKDKLNF